MAAVRPVRHLASMPPEILHLIAAAYIDDLHAVGTSNITSVLCSCSLLHDLVLPKLYASVHIYSLEQLVRFVAPASGAHKYCAHHTRDTLVVNIPGVPGGGDGTLYGPDAKTHSRDRLTLVSRALALCPQVQKLSLEFFSIRHSEILTEADFRTAEADAFASAIAGLSRVTALRWVPPRSDANAIMGLSIVIVDQIIPALAKGLSGCTSLETLELWNTMLPATGGADLAEALISIAHARAQQNPDDAAPLKLNLRSVTGLDPRSVSDLALATPPVQVNIADGFVGSIWGARIDTLAVHECMRDALDPAGRTRSTGSSPSTSDTSSVSTGRVTTPELLIQDSIAKASRNITIRILQGGIAGARMFPH